MSGHSARYEELARLDRAHVWHPFTQMAEYAEPVIVERGEGIRLIDVEGRSYYDGVSSIWLNVHGHRVAAIDAAIRAQLDKIAHSTLLGQGNVPSIELAARLVKLLPPGLSHVFYSDSGAESVEIALKMAYQYWRLVGQPERRRFIAMTDAYHGDTIGAVSVGGMEIYHGTFRDLVFETLRAPYPYPYRFDGDAAACRDHCLNALDKLLTDHAGEVCGLIVEPIIAGAAGIIVMPEGFLGGVEALCRKHDVLLITDEVATGFGRTGRLFAVEHEGVVPDILMTAKGITGGYLPLAATVANDRVYHAFLGAYAEHKTFFHGHSYTGNQLACAAALANLDLFAEHDLVAKVARQGEWLAARLGRLTSLPHVGEVRGRGFMWGIELVRDQATKAEIPWDERAGHRVCERCRELGMLLRPLGSVVVFMPPLAATDAELTEMTDILERALRETRFDS